MNQKTQKFYQNIKKSPLTPPSYTFGIVWPILYVLLLFYFINLTLHHKCPGICPAAIVFIIQMLFNVSWSPVFFRLKKIRWALFINFMMIVLTIITMYLNRKIKAQLNYLLVPYLLWISFAFYLNGYIVVKNPKLY